MSSSTPYTSSTPFTNNNVNSPTRPTDSPSLFIGASVSSIGVETPTTGNFKIPGGQEDATSSGVANWSENSAKQPDGTASEKSLDTSKLNRKESYKAQRKNYRREKKRVASELLNSLQDPAVIVLADWLKTYCANTQVADSACTATAFLGGVKGNYGTLGLTAKADIDDCIAENNTNNRVHSIAQWAQVYGMATGLITNTKVTHASPAGVYAHSVNRNWENDAELKRSGGDPNVCMDIAKQLIYNREGHRLKVIFGGGRQEFLPEKYTDVSGNKGKRTDNLNLMKIWKHKHRKQHSVIVQNKEQLMNLPESTDYVLGLFASDHMPFHLDADNATHPTLSEMVSKALDVLEKQRQGYFLFVEGGRIDHAHHDTEAVKAIDETVEFAKAVEVARKRTSDQNTLIVVTADHSHTMSVAGYSSRKNDIFGINNSQVGSDELPYATLSYANGPGFENNMEAQEGRRRNLREVNMRDKVRGTLKSWTKLWCVLKPGLLLLYKSPKTKSSHWVGTILLTSCQAIERPSKKDGFCFKLFHPLEQSIWAPRGPDKETIGAVIQPLPTSYLIFRAPSQGAGKCWMDALELSLRCSALLLRSNSNSGTSHEQTAISGTISHETQWSEADYEKHFDEHGDTTKSERPQFLAKYLPPTPPIDKRMLTVTLPKTKPILVSPCPSPTPIFQQLYLAVAHWERVMSNSPDFIKQKFQKVRGMSLNRSKDTIDNKDDTSDVSSFGGSPSPCPIRRSSSLNHVSIPTENNDVTPSRRKSTPANFRRSLSHIDLDIDSQNENVAAVMSGLDSESDSDGADFLEPEEVQETPYVHLPEEEFGAAGEQVEELAEEHKSLIWYLVKQVRPGMDLSKVVLPTFILEPRSFLDKLSDSYYHANYLSRAVLEDDPFTRMKTVVQWYMSGFYKKPKGLKKPYNPILGETFRCYWEHPNGSRTFYLAEQVSHHPPVSAFYVTNRQDGFAISCSILAKSKFYGNSTSAILNGVATLTLLPRGESYTLTIPYAHCKGILMGTLSMELGGKVYIECENTGYKTDIEFKLKPFLGGAEYTNVVTGRLKLGKETLATINGHWDSDIKIKDIRSQEENLLFCATPEVRANRLKRFVVPIESQVANESERLWQHVAAAIRRDDQEGATEEKTALEEAQRALAKERKAVCTEWTPAYFQQDLMTGQWHYKYADLRPWDPRNDLKQFEYNYRIQTKTRHQAPMLRTASIVSSEPITILSAESRSSLVALKSSKRVLKAKRIAQGTTPNVNEHISDSSQSNDDNDGRFKENNISDILRKLTSTLEEHSKRLAAIQLNLEKLAYAPPQRLYNAGGDRIQTKTIFLIVLGLIINLIFVWFFK